MATAKTNTTMTLKLLVDTNSKKVLFAEAGKDFVDFLFGLLQLPLGSILAALVGNKNNVSGSFGKIYKSVQDLDTDYLQPNQTKNLLLKPKPASSHTKHSPLLNELAYQQNADSLHTKHSPSLNEFMFGKSSFAIGGPLLNEQVFHKSADSSSASVDGYVRGVVTYMVMDDLTVKPMSTISSITLLNALHVKDIGCLEEKTVQVDTDKGLKLMKLSFVSTTVLTDLFLKENSEYAKENPSVNLTVD